MAMVIERHELIVHRIEYVSYALRITAVEPVKLITMHDKIQLAIITRDTLLCKIPSLRVSFFFAPTNTYYTYIQEMTTPTVTSNMAAHTNPGRMASVDLSETCRSIPTDPRRLSSSQREHKLLKPWQP